MPDYSWDLDTNSDGTVNVDFVEGGLPTVTRAQTVPVSLRWASTNVADYETVIEYLNYAHAVATFTANDGTPYYRQLHSNAREPLVGLNPNGADIPSQVPGVWGVIVGGVDLTGGTVGSNLGIQLQVFILAEYSEYGSRSTAKTAHSR